MTDAVTELFRRAMSLPDDFELRDDMGMDDVPGWDSLGTAYLVMHCEQLLGIALAMEDLVGISSVGDVRKLVSGTMLPVAP